MYNFDSNKSQTLLVLCWSPGLVHVRCFHSLKCLLLCTSRADLMKVWGPKHGKYRVLKKGWHDILLLLSAHSDRHPEINQERQARLRRYHFTPDGEEPRSVLVFLNVSRKIKSFYSLTTGGVSRREFIPSVQVQFTSWFLARCLIFFLFFF